MSAQFAMLLTLAVALRTPHEHRGTFQRRYSARFIVSRRVRQRARRVPHPSQKGCGLGRSAAINLKLTIHDFVNWLFDTTTSSGPPIRGRGLILVLTYLSSRPIAAAILYLLHHAPSEPPFPVGGVLVC